MSRTHKHKRVSCFSPACLLIGLGVAGLASGRGVSPYLPLGVSPAIERDFERVLVLAGKPVMRRPIAAATVLDALPVACAVDRALCQRVRAYVERYQEDWGLTQAQVEVSATAGESDRALPNAHGRSTQSNWQAVGAGFYQPNDYLLLNAGGIAYEGRARPTGTLLSAGFDWAQLDVGFRDHWLSPLSTASMLISTEAPTMPSVTLSNYRPLSPLGITYELFAARMSHQDGIEYLAGTTSGNPYLVGIQLSIEPVVGYALSVNKLMQYGGGARGGAGLKELRAAIFDNNIGVNSSDGTNGNLEFGNQLASVTGTMQFPGAVPFAFSVEYAGEDYLYAYDGNYRLGDSALSIGLNIPKLWRRFDLNLEASEWQNAWYVHHLYPKGLTNDGSVLGHWFGDQRQFADPVAGHSQVLQVGMRTDNDGYWSGTYRTLAFTKSVGFQSQPEVPYRHLHELGLNYSTTWRGYQVSTGLLLGRDAFGEKYGRLSASLDLAGKRFYENTDLAENDGVAQGDKVEFFADVGFNRSRVYRQISKLYPDYWTPVHSDYHIGFGARRPVAERSDLGVRLELDRVGEHNLLSIRALDYRFKITPGIAAGAFAGVGRYGVGSPAFGWYGGLGVQVLEVFPKWNLNFDWRYHDKLSRDRVLESDPPSTSERPRLHFDVKGYALYVSRVF